MIAFFCKLYYSIKNYRQGFSGKPILAVLLFTVMVMAGGCTSLPGARHTADPGAGAVDMVIGFYQGPMDHLNAVRTGHCPMYPSCSNYSRQAVGKHGLFKGSMLAFDRLMRCGRSELDYAPKIPVNGKWRYYDPVSANDFWFSAQP